MFEPFATEYDPNKPIVYRVATVQELKEMAIQIYCQADTLEPVIDMLRDLAGSKDTMLSGLATIVENFQRLAAGHAESIETSLVGMQQEQVKGLPKDSSKRFVLREVES